MIQGQFRELVKGILEKIKTLQHSSDQESKTLCSHLVYGLTWFYRRDDFEWLAKLNIFETLLAGNLSIRKSLGEENSPLKFDSLIEKDELPLANCIW